jgi:hypothetical protein
LEHTVDSTNQWTEKIKLNCGQFERRSIWCQEILPAFIRQPISWKSKHLLGFYICWDYLNTPIKVCVSYGPHIVLDIYIYICCTMSLACLNFLLCLHFGDSETRINGAKVNKQAPTQIFLNIFYEL